ncbi:MAG TPA: PAS domain-containing protein [Beijerinckiaceae bacterium]|nr:PAS domain-containing protein [Beijerinckiaceae bacterium]
MRHATLSERALVLAPRGRDAAIAVAMLTEAGFAAQACASIPALINKLDAGAGFVIVTEEAVATADLAPLDAWLAGQEEWSDLPFVLLTNHGGGLERNPAAARFLEVLGNVTFLERPFHPTTLISLARSALRGRRRQYEARARLEALRESEGRFAALAENVSQLAWMAEPDGRIFWYNKRWYDYTGTTLETMQGWGWRDVHHPDHLERVIGEVQANWARGEPWEGTYLLRGQDGVFRPFLTRAEPIYDEAGKLVRWFGTNTDITAQRRAEERLRELNETLEARVADRTAELTASQRRFRGIFDSALQFMALLTPGGTVVEVNQTALQWSRIGPADIVGKPFWRAAPMRGNPSLQAAIEMGVRRAAAGETVREEHEMRGAGEVRAVVDFSLKPVLGDQGEPIWLVAEGRDITELKRAQDALRQAQKLEAVGQLTGGVAHDFNNLLTIIKSSTDLLRRPGLAEERRARYVDAISDTVDRASRLTGQLLAFARRQSLKPETFDATQRLHAITDMLRTIVGSRIQIVTEISEDVCLVEADVSQFETALVNMAVNARDAMNGEGTLTIRIAGVSEIPAIRGHSGAPGRFVAVSIADTGVGIPKDKHTQVFEPFFTTKEVGKGTGLGLSQVYGFAKQSGGDVTVESQVGRGTTFTLYLPRTDVTALTGDVATSDAGPAPALEEGHGRRVLVVEDNMEVGRFSTQILQDLGYETTWAANADEALTLLANVNGFDAVFSDVIMPGMGGVELGEEIRRRYPGLPVVLTSGYSHVLAEEGRHGFELLQKPYAAEELSRVLRQATRKRRTLEVNRLPE